MSSLKICACQIDIFWEDYELNLEKVNNIVKQNSYNTNIIIFPEMFLTGFSMNTKVSINENSHYIHKLKNIAIENKISLCGSLMIEENSKYYNRFYYFSYTGKIFTYNKRHLFRMANEHNFYSAGNKHTIITENNFQIAPFICYDLRFPVWMRNVNNNFDIIIVVANWPQKRIEAWETLLKARAIENQCYVIGVNRVGKDNNNILYNGGTCIYDYQGKLIVKAKDFEEDVIIATLHKDELYEYRSSFPAFLDADKFQIL